ncbi:MAG TPA: hypothetical protein VHN74_15610 [Candidatus Angelobacter sp.]|nr:hypothetical protein [Candidatus Angelobacter sp.]
MRIFIAPGQIRALYSRVSMRRVCSILTVMGLLFSVVSPVWAADVESMQPMQCHREHMQTARPDQPQVHRQHCHGMDESPVQTSAETSVRAVNAAKQCPMNCCVEGMTQSVSVVPAAVYLPLVVVTDRSIPHTLITFISSGFSSHTDRGPPLR